MSTRNERTLALCADCDTPVPAQYKDDSLLPLASGEGGRCRNCGGATFLEHPLNDD